METSPGISAAAAQSDAELSRRLADASNRLVKATWVLAGATGALVAACVVLIAVLKTWHDAMKIGAASGSGL